MMPKLENDSSFRTCSSVIPTDFPFSVIPSEVEGSSFVDRGSYPSYSFGMTEKGGGFGDKGFRYLDFTRGGGFVPFSILLVTLCLGGSKNVYRRWIFNGKQEKRYMKFSVVYSGFLG